MMVWTSEYGKARYQKLKERIKAQVAAYRKANQEKAKAAVQRCFDSYDPEDIRKYHAEYYAQHSDRIKEQVRLYQTINYERDRAKKSARGRRWRQEHPDKNSAKSNRRRAAVMRRLPSWLTDEEHWMISEVYELAQLRSKLTGVPHHVDHIIPLQGKIVSGLHVPTNLQVVTAERNLRKLNRFS